MLSRGLAPPRVSRVSALEILVRILYILRGYSITPFPTKLQKSKEKLALSEYLINMKCV